jgi:hypothetical protein
VLLVLETLEIAFSESKAPVLVRIEPMADMGSSLFEVVVPIYSIEGGEVFQTKENILIKMIEYCYSHRKSTPQAFLYKNCL